MPVSREITSRGRRIPASARERGLLVEIMDNDSLLGHVAERHPVFGLVFQAGKGDAAARRRLRRKNAALVGLADVLRGLHDRDASENGAASQEMTDGAAAD